MTAPVIDPAVETGPVVDDPEAATPDGIPPNAAPISLPVMAVEGLETADGRYLEPGGISHRALPLSLLAQIRTPDGGQGHDNAWIVGAVTSMTRRPGPEVISKATDLPFPEGTFVWSGEGWMYTDVPEGKSAYQMVKDRALSGNSIDLTEMDVELQFPEGTDPEDPAAYPDRVSVRSAVVAASTLVSVPAFPDAFVEIGGELMVPEGGQVITASAVSWRSLELGDPCALCAAGLEFPEGEEDPDAEPVVDVTAEPDAKPQHTGGMIALVPADPTLLTVDGGEPAEELHMTLAYLGDDVTGWDGTLVNAVHELALQLTDSTALPTDDPDTVISGPGDDFRSPAQRGPITLNVFAHGVFNPNGGPTGDPATVYLFDGEDGRSAAESLQSEVCYQVRNAIGEVNFPEQHARWEPHVTAGFQLDPGALTFTGPVTFDRLRVALGGTVTDYPLGGGQPMVAAAPLVLAADAFTVPEGDGPTPLTFTDDGRVFGHIAEWSTCHIGFPGQCVTAPRSPSGYSYFHTGVVATTAGDLAVGQITLNTRHADLTDNAQMAARHYDHTGTVAADVRLTDGQYGIWASGVVRSSLNAEQLHAFRAAPPSGDWRQIRGVMEMVAVLAVNVPGFPVPRARVASGVPLALVAAGVVAEQRPVQAFARSQADRELLAWAREKMTAERHQQALEALAEAVDVDGLADGARSVLADIATWAEERALREAER